MAQRKLGTPVDTRPEAITQLTGVDAEAARAWIASQEPLGEGSEEAPDLSEPTAVWPCNWQVLQLFMRLQTQWHHDAAGRPTGLRYAGVHARLQVLRVNDEDRARLWDELDDMEHAVLEAWDEL